MFYLLRDSSNPISCLTVSKHCWHLSTVVMITSAVRDVADTAGAPEEVVVEEAAAVVAEEAAVAEAVEVYGQTAALDAYHNKRTAARAPWVADVDSCQLET